MNPTHVEFRLVFGKLQDSLAEIKESCARPVQTGTKMFIGRSADQGRKRPIDVTRDVYARLVLSNVTHLW